MRGAILQRLETEEGNQLARLEMMLSALKQKGFKLSKPLKYFVAGQETPVSTKHTLILTNNKKTKIQFELKLYQ